MSTRAECGSISFRATASVVLKGKASAIEVWEPLQQDDGRADFMTRYGQAYAMLKKGSDGAGALFETLAHDAPGDPCVAFHLGRIRQGIVGDSVIMTEK